MTISQVLGLAQKEALRLEMEVFLSHLLGKSRLDLIAHGEEEIPVQHLAPLQKAWIEIKGGKPVAYLTGEKEFYGLTFRVNEAVLIPRPCTELLVDLAAAKAKKKVLELGTGSGVISIALKSKRPDLSIVATDLSLDALAVARANAKKMGVDIEFLQADLLQGLAPADYDTLLANLPYIGTETHALIDENVRDHEPALALFGGKDGLDVYRRLFGEIAAGTWNFERIIGEIGFTQGEDAQRLAAELLPQYFFALHQDLEGLDRHFVLERKGEIC